MTAYRLVNRREYKRPTGSSCQHCGRPATVIVDRVRVEGGMRLELRLCAEHDELLAAVINETRQT